MDSLIGNKRSTCKNPSVVPVFDAHMRRLKLRIFSKWQPIQCAGWGKESRKGWWRSRKFWLKVVSRKSCISWRKIGKERKLRRVLYPVAWVGTKLSPELKSVCDSSMTIRMTKCVQQFNIPSLMYSIWPQGNLKSKTLSGDFNRIIRHVVKEELNGIRNCDIITQCS